MTSVLHWAHMVSVSPYPLMSGMKALFLTYGSLIWWKFSETFLMKMSCMGFFFSCYGWWLGVKLENQEGEHDYMTSFGMGAGMLFFIMSEICFFAGFFWAYFHICLAGSFEAGYVWPPMGFETLVVDPYSVPFLKTVLLVSSGVTVTVAHHTVMTGDWKLTNRYLFLTVLLGALFIYFQGFEYAMSDMSINTTYFGTIFFVLTGFHGAHVSMGVMFLLICLFRLNYLNFSSESFMGFECAIWYWHFVDVVWLFLYFFLYYYSCALFHMLINSLYLSI